MEKKGKNTKLKENAFKETVSLQVSLQRVNSLKCAETTGQLLL